MWCAVAGAVDAGATCCRCLWLFVNVCCCVLLFLVAGVSSCGCWLWFAV